MRSGSISDNTLEALLREYRAELLLEREPELARAVPRSADLAAQRAFRQMDALAAAGAAPAPAVKRAAPPRRVPWRAAVLTVAAAGALAAGAAAAFPALRSASGALVSGLLRPAPEPERAPGDYAIPSPGEDFAVVDEAVSERVAARWFRSQRQQLMVQIARRLPDEAETPPDAVWFAASDALAGCWYRDGDSLVARLDSDGTRIQVVFFNAEPEELIAYCELLAEANARP